MGHKNSYHFGPYHLNGRESLLLRDGSPVALTPKAFDTLVVLVRNSGHLVEKEALMKEVWPETIVEESNLTQNIFTLRRILGEDGTKSKYIETVPRRGYRFVAPVREVTESESAVLPFKKHQPSSPGLEASHQQGVGVLAVLPFVNASGDANMEYLSDGITVSVINSLSQLPMLRVMSRSIIFRYKGTDLDAQHIGKELGVTTVLVGRVHSANDGLLISAELVDVANGWQLWGETYDRGARSIFEVQDEIAKEISSALRLKLTGEDARRLTLRYTENPSAYQAYLKGRYHWVKYNKKGLWKALEYFETAINLDPYYVLAYAGSVDCCLRLATNYIPPEDNYPQVITGTLNHKIEHATDIERARTVKLRYEWDQKTVERELRRAEELKSNYPAAHQWHAAYQLSIEILKKGLGKTGQMTNFAPPLRTSRYLPFKTDLRQFLGCSPTLAEEVQIVCAIAREQVESGNYEAASLLLERWWTFGQWPNVDGLSPESSSDLLFTTGVLAGYHASAKQVPAGQKHAEALLSGAIALFEQLGSRRRAAEGRIELGWCYYREGLFRLTGETLQAAIDVLQNDEIELRSLAFVRLATIDHTLGRLHDARERLSKLTDVVELLGPLARCRYHSELATTLKELAISENRSEYFDQALHHFNEALYEFDAIGHHRYAALVENNHGYLLLALQRLGEAEVHLIRARNLFEVLCDQVKQAQVNDTLARLHIAAHRYKHADQCISRSIAILEAGGEDALLAQSLRTKGLVLCRLSEYRAAKKVLERAQQVAEHCGDIEGGGRAILVLIEEMRAELSDEELMELGAQLYKLLANSQMASIRERLTKSLKEIGFKSRKEI